MNPLTNNDFTAVFHFTPLHYLVFIARSEALFSKQELLKQGFAQNHFRTKSKKQDLERGFGDKAHLTTSSMPPILQAKLQAGFPHVGLRINSSSFDDQDFELCRFNVAMTRMLRRGNHAGHKTTPENGEYYEGIQIPIARNFEEQSRLLAAAKKKNRMVEVLVDHRFDLGENTTVIAFSAQDAEKAKEILNAISCAWPVVLELSANYEAKQEHFEACSDFLTQVIQAPDWRGNGLEFDKV